MGLISNCASIPDAGFELEKMVETSLKSAARPWGGSRLARLELFCIDVEFLANQRRQHD